MIWASKGPVKQKAGQVTSNAIKFAHNDNKIKIGCVRDNGCHKFFIEDTGIDYVWLILELRFDEL